MTYRTGDERPVLNIEGELVALGPLRRDLLSLCQRWINDLVAARGLGVFLPITVEKESEWFEFVGLHNVMLRAFGFNRGAVRAYEKAGFKEIGSRRQCYFAGGRAWDEIWMDCLSTEFETPTLRQHFETDEG